MKLLAIMLAGVSVTGCATTTTQADDIFGIGHSLLSSQLDRHRGSTTNDVGIFKILAKDGGKSLQNAKQQDIPGAPLKYNWEQPGPAGDSHSYEYGVELAAAEYDYFVITEGMPLIGNYNYNDSRGYADNFYDAAITNNADMEFFLFSTWNCWDVCGGLFEQMDLDKPYWEDIASYVEINNPGAVVNIIPGGEALRRLNTAIVAGEVDGETSLTTDFFYDFVHLNDAGKLYMGYVWYATIYKESPVGLTSDISPYSHGLSAAAVTTLQELAWDTVCGYEPSNVPCSKVNMAINMGNDPYWASAYMFNGVMRPPIN